jgi:Autotransporter beta-domain
MSTALRCGLIKASALAGTVLAVLSLPSGASAQCKDNTGLILAAGLPLQTIYPLGIGNSFNALLSTINTVNTAFLTNTASFVSAPGGASANQQSGGVWGRTVAGYADTTATSNSILFIPAQTITTPSGPISLPAVNGAGTCTGTVHEEYVGSQFGFDLGTLNLGGGGGNIHFGITGGYFNSKSKDLTGPGPADPLAVVTMPDGRLEVDSQVPFAGIYGVFTQGGFFADTLLRFDLYKNTITDRSNGIAGQSLDAHGLAVTANMGYRFSLPSDWFIEPSIGGVWSRVAIEDFSTNGVNAPFKSDPTKVLTLGQGDAQFQDIESLLGRASLRMGTTITNGNYIWQPFGTASVLREFAGPAKATAEVTSSGTNSGATIAIATDRVGTYAQFGLGTSVVFGTSGWLGYGRVDYKTGENVEGVNVNVGFRHQW